MQADLHEDLTRRLVADYGFKVNKAWLQEGQCPDCKKKELFARAEAPWVVKCGRENKCGWQGHVKELYPDAFASWSDRFKATEQQPNAAADAYLRDGRGFDLSKIAGWYRQDTYFDREKQIGTATVRFSLPGGFWERFIDRPERFGKKKARFNYGIEYHGTWWQPPTQSNQVEELWLVEGIFDAIALMHNGIAAVSLMSCNNYPQHALAGLAQQCLSADRQRPTLVWALDGDRVGRSYTRKWVRRARSEGWDCKAAQIPQPAKGKHDWNDLHQRERLTEKDLATYRYYGALLIAESATEKALLMYNHSLRRDFPFDFDRRLYWFKLDIDKFNKAMEAQEESDDGRTTEEKRDQALAESGVVAEIANCSPTALYYQANALTDESWYYFRVEFPHDGAAIKNTFTGGQLASASEFKKRMLAIAPGAVFTGNSAQLDRLLKDQLFDIKTVQTVDFVGYSREFACYVLGNIAVKDGAVHELNEEDFFDLGKLSIKTLSQSVGLSINTDPKSYQTTWLGHIWQCFGAKGLVALVYWFGSLFAEQIRAEQKSYPFLEVVGEPGAGKSTLIEFLWKLLGRRDYEGFDPSKSSLAARARNFAQVANLPVVLIESDREDSAKTKGWDWDELKTAYNGRSVRARGMKNGGNETYEPPFRGAIVISQNATVNASEAILQRIVHLHFDRTNQTAHTKALAEELERMPMEHVSGFILAALGKEPAILSTMFEQLPIHERELQALPELRAMRIAKNHAQLLALTDAIQHVVPFTPEQRAAVHDMVISMAKERQQAINADHPMVQEFWELFDYLNGETYAPVLNHAKDPGLIAVNLNHFAQVAADNKQQFPQMVDLKRLLTTSKRRKFVGNKAVNSNIQSRTGTGKTVKCWVFENPEGARRVQ